MKEEPVVTTGFIIAVIGAAVALAVSLGMNLNKDQVAAIMGFVTVIAPLTAAFISRGHVVPISKIQRGVINLVPSPFDPTGGSTLGTNLPLSVLGTGNNPGNVLAPGGTTPLQPVFAPGNVVAPGGTIPLTQSFSGGSQGQLSAPSVNSAAYTAAGGTLAPGLLGYRLTTTNALGETGPGPEFGYTVPTGTSTNTVTLNWTPNSNGTSTKVYGRTVGNEQLLVTLGAGVATWTDTGAVTPSGVMPSANTTGTPAVAPGGIQTPGNVVAPGGSVPLQQGVDPTP